MDAKTNNRWTLSLGIAAGSIVAGGLAYMLMTREASDIPEDIKDITSISQIKSLVRSEVSKITKPKKGSDYTFDEDFTISVFYYLSKYGTLAEQILKDMHFETRVNHLKDMKMEDYEKSFVDLSTEEPKVINSIKNEVLGALGIIEAEYVISFEKHKKSTTFAEKLEAKKKIIEEEIVKKADNTVPEALTKEIANEIFQFSRQYTMQAMQQIDKQARSQTEYRSLFMFELMKLDDIIYLQYGFKKEVVIEAFTKHSIITPQAAAGQIPGGMAGVPGMSPPQPVGEGASAQPLFT